MGRKVWVCCPFVFWVVSNDGVAGLCKKGSQALFQKLTPLLRTSCLIRETYTVHQLILFSLLILYPIF